MSEKLHITSETGKTECYEALIPQLTTLVEEEPDLTANLANLANLGYLG